MGSFRSLADSSQVPESTRSPRHHGGPNGFVSHFLPTIQYALRGPDSPQNWLRSVRSSPRLPPPPRQSSVSPVSAPRPPHATVLFPRVPARVSEALVLRTYPFQE